MMNDDAINVPGCSGTTVKQLCSQPELQVLLVEVQRGGTIPLHEHDCAATMVITKGSATTLGKGGRIVKKGDVVVKTAHEPHGFADISEDFAFLSISDGLGIMQTDHWDLQFQQV